MNRDLVFVTAQPDVPYFIWQIKLYVNNFIDKGIDPNQIHVVYCPVLNAFWNYCNKFKYTLQVAS